MPQNREIKHTGDRLQTVLVGVEVEAWNKIRNRSNEEQTANKRRRKKDTELLRDIIVWYFLNYPKVRS